MTLPLIQNIYIAGLMALISLYLLFVGVLSSIRYWQCLHRTQRDLIDSINSLLPQTQCGQCGFEGCLPYAKAIAKGTAINQCPPGGQQTIARLAELLHEKPLPLNPAHGNIEPFKVAYIREEECIGCTKCIKACPVDAILGGAKLMHTVITSECTGCDLCVAPCPVDCIDMLPVTLITRWQQQMPSQLPTLAYTADRS